jgi:hypothetical protein
MKNVHLLPTDKLIKSAGDLVKDKYGSIHIFTKNDGKEYGKTTTKLNIYITDNSEIKEGNYVVVDCSEIEIEEVRLVIGYYNEQFLFDDRGQIHMDYSKKIILTTDQDLINDGVQPIDDEFLEWFVKNPSCEFVETQCSGRNCIEDFGCTKEGCNGVEPLEIIIPQEELKQEYVKCTCANSLEYSNCGKKCERILDEQEPKQETIEETYLNQLIDEANKEFTLDRKLAKDVAVKYANWQAERMYSKEEVIAIVEKSRETGLTAEYLLLTDQFKKK